MSQLQDRTLRLLLIEDVPADAERAAYQFKRAGLQCETRRVDSVETLVAALDEFAPTVILSDFTLPGFDGMKALQICREHAPEVPFLFLSGTIGEERAVDALRAGAVDYVLKENLTRLVPAALRAIDDAAVRAERTRQDAHIARLNRVLRMLKGINEVTLRVRDRAELLAETCRLAISLGDYAVAVAATRFRGGASIKAVASNGMEEQMTARISAYVEQSAAQPTSIIGRVFSSGREFVCRDANDAAVTARLDALMTHAGMRAVVILPLLVDGETSAVLLLVARDAQGLGTEELDMLRDLAHSLSFGLQYMQRDTRARFLSHFHPQTGLAGRTLFCERLRDSLAGPGAASRHAAVIMDLRRLGAINDAFGRHAGDLLLRQVAERLKAHHPQAAQLGHFGGGTFALALTLPADTDVGAVLQGYEQALFGRPLSVDRREVPVSVRFASAQYPDDGRDAMQLVQEAETALQAARASGQPYARFNAAVRTQSVGVLAMEHRLRFALERGEFELHYQPKVNVITRRIQGAEALLRWRSPEDGLMPPDAFLPVLESSDLILRVGEWVVAQAARDCRAWMAAGLPPLRVAVNIAPAQLRGPEFEQQFLQAVGTWPSALRGLDIEITEGVLQEDSGTEIRKLEKLRAAGIRIAIDDFGTGYSSLSRLAALPVDTLKIDRKFISQIVHNPTGATVVRTVVALAHAFNMNCVAEGVERQEELDELWHMGCDQSQGYLHCAPVPAAEFAAVLQHGRGVLIRPPEAEAPAEPDQQQQGAA